MSEHFQHNTKFANSINQINQNKYNERVHSSYEAPTSSQTYPYDHMYASNNKFENGEPTNQLTDAPNCQSAESEVRFWKDWLILHLDLIQQQNDDIATKERKILVLQQENEMLKERISCMEEGAKLRYAHAPPPAMTCDAPPAAPAAAVKREPAADLFAELSVDIKTECGYDCTLRADDPLRSNLRMSIRRKRASSASAASSAAGGAARRRRRAEHRPLVTRDRYVTEAGAPHGEIARLGERPTNAESALEVPRWRVKVYASCYTMEGTENLDDEVFNKRHSRLETAERRRKKWDVQMIRQQRVIEKLKQRQERISSGSRSEDQSEPVQSLWPNLDEVKFLEVTDELPVAAFGCLIPKIAPSEFSLPWLNNPSLLATKKVPGKRSTVRRKSSKR